MQYQDKELFQGYEIKNWNFTPRLYKLFGAAAIFNILFLLVVVQANVFTTRGCDSPLVGNFCQVLDTIYLGSTLLDTNTDFVSEDYKVTKIEDAEITYIDVTGVNNQPLAYPEGYFALANPESAMMPMPVPDMNGNFPVPSPNFNGFPTNPTMMNPTTSSVNPLALPQVTPTPNKNIPSGDAIDDSLFEIQKPKIGRNPVPPPPIGSTAKNRPPFGKKRETGNAPKPPTPEKTPAKPDENQPPLESDAIVAFRPNKKPLEDFAAGIVAKREDKTKPLDLTKNFKVRMVGELDKDGKLIKEKTRYVPLKPDEQGDQAMVDTAKLAIEAINDGNMFYYLKQIGIDKVDFTLIQDDEQIYAIISSNQKTEKKAERLSSDMSLLLGLAKLGIKEEELRTLIDSAKTEQQGKNFVLNFKIDKLVAQALITKKLDEAEAKKKAAEQNPKPASTATVNTNQKTAK